VPYQISLIYVIPHFIIVQHCLCHIKSPQFMLIRISSVSSTVSALWYLPYLFYSRLMHCPVQSVPCHSSSIYVTPHFIIFQHCQCHIKSPQFMLPRTALISSTVSVISNLHNFYYSTLHKCSALSVPYQISPIYVTPQSINFCTVNIISNLPNLCYTA
jgi:hypothetical protein